MTLGHYRRKDGERPEEFAARMIIETNSAWKLEVIDDGKSGPGLVDYQMLYNGNPAGVLEVGRNTDREATANTAAWLRQASQPRALSGLKWSWGLLCDAQKAKFKGIFGLVHPILKELESAGKQRADRYERDGWQPDSFGGRLMAIGVLSASVIDQNRNPGHVFVSLGSSAEAPLGPQAVIAELEQWLGSGESDQTGLRRKLSSSHLQQRHAFVWVDLRSSWAAWRALDEPALPTQNPRLPNPINGVWVASGAAGWTWSAESGWSKLRNVAAAISHAQ